VAEERRKHHRREFCELHDASNRDGGQRFDVRCGGEQFCGLGNEQHRHADRKYIGGGADDHRPAYKSDGDGRAVGDVFSSRHRYSSIELSMGEEWCHDFRRNLFELYHSRDCGIGQRVTIHGGGQQLLG